VVDDILEVGLNDEVVVQTLPMMIESVDVDVVVVVAAAVVVVEYSLQLKNYSGQVLRLLKHFVLRYSHVLN
jgi:hypothetical protein